MRTILTLILFLLIAAPASAQVRFISNKCDAMDDDDEDKGWCYFDLAAEKKSLKDCNYFDMWGMVDQCIDYVAKVKKLTAQDCDELVQFRDTCLAKLGFPVTERVSPEEAAKRLQPCAELLTKSVQLPKAESDLKQDIIARLKMLRRSLYMALQAEVNKHVDKNVAAQEAVRNQYRADYSVLYNKIMITCEESARQTNDSDILGVISQQGQDM